MTTAAANPTGQELVSEMAKTPTIDEFFLRNPQGFGQADYQALVARQRDERALFITKDTERADKEKDE